MKLHIDNIEYKQKPRIAEIKKISGRIVQNLADVNVKELADALKKGRSFVAANLSKKNNGKLRCSNNCWTSQEVICLDFDNEYYDKKTKRKYKKVEMTIEKAQEEFKESAAFIYTTFNHTKAHPKLRVVFVLDEVIKEYDTLEALMNKLLERYPTADKRCSNGSRIFFGGKEIIEINYDNKLVVKNYINKDEFCGAGGFTYQGYINTYSIIGRKNPPSEKMPINQRDFLKLIEYASYSNEGYTCSHINDAYEYLYKQDLASYLTKTGYLKSQQMNFHCIFHNDSQPSASIFRDEKTGNYMYKCHSESCGFTGNIVRVTERLTGMRRVETFKYLCKHYNVDIVESEWQKQQKEIMDHNIHILSSEWFKDEHPELYKRIKRYIPLLIMMNLLSKQYIGTNTLREVEKNMFSASKKYLSQMAKELSGVIAENYGQLEYTKINSDIKEISKRVDLFAFLGVINKIHINDLPKELYQIAVIEREKKLKKGRDVNFQNYYSIPEYDDQLMTSANQRADDFKKNNMSMIGFGREMVTRGIGKEEADKVYPMLSKLEISKKSDEISEYIKKKFIDVIENKGWVTEGEILDELVKENLEKTDGMVKGRTRNEKNIKKSLNELIEGYGLRRERLNKKLKNKLGINDEISGYPFVIYKN